VHQRPLAAGVPLLRSMPLLPTPRSREALRVRASSSPYQEAEVRCHLLRHAAKTSLCTCTCSVGAHAPHAARTNTHPAGGTRAARAPEEHPGPGQSRHLGAHASSEKPCARRCNSTCERRVLTLPFPPRRRRCHTCRSFTARDASTRRRRAGLQLTCCPYHVSRFLRCLACVRACVCVRQDRCDQVRRRCHDRPGAEGA
jgi:hypothetical protein